MYTSQTHNSGRGPFGQLNELDDLPITFAFQPIVEGKQAKVIGYEALVRGVAGQPAGAVLSSIRPENRERFDQAVRLRAIREASRLGIQEPLHLNCSWISPENLAPAMVGMLNTANACGMSRDSLVLELQNLERLGSLQSLDELRRRMKEFRVNVLVDQFGAGTADLTLLAVLRPDLVKLDRRLISGIHRSRGRQGIVAGIAAACHALGIKLIALGVEDAAELYWLSTNGVRLFQGFYFGHPTADRAQRGATVNDANRPSNLEPGFVPQI